MKFIRITFFLLFLCLMIAVQGQVHHFECGVDDSKILKSYARDGPYFWSEQIIPYDFLEGTPTQIQNTAKHAMIIYKQNTNLCFIPRWSEEKYLSVEEKTGEIGWGGLTGIGIDHSLFVSIHELGHALQLRHEHQRPDRDDYVTVVDENINPDRVSQFTKGSYGYNVYDTPYDYNSVMHYPAYAYSINNKKTIIAPDSVSLGNTTLSPGDIIMLNRMYPNKIDCDSAFHNRPPRAHFKQVVNQEECDNSFVEYTDLSNGAEEIEWIFEGGTPSISNEVSPKVYYPYSGSFKVIQIVKNQYGEHTTSKFIKLEKCNDNKGIYPNPSDGLIYINTGMLSPKSVDIQVFSSEGRLVYSQTHYEPKGFNYEIQIDLKNQISNGIYIVKVVIFSETITKKILIHK